MINKGSKVKILRKESYWYQDIGTVFRVEQTGRYPITVRFARQAYNNVSINNFSENEVVLVN